ncbi:MAG: hypothetical protein ACLFQM_10325 [Fidelibacterota bacterium]
MQTKQLIFILITSLLLIFQCSVEVPSESDMPSWEVQLNIPMGEETFYIEDILDDSTFSSYGLDNGDSVLSYEDNSLEIERTVVGDSLKIDDISESFSQSVDEVTVNDVEKDFVMSMDEVTIDPFSKDFSSNIGLITLNNNEPIESDPVQLDEIIDFSFADEGDQMEIPQATALPVVHRSIEFDQFNDANIQSGYIDLQIFNDLTIELGAPVSITLLNPDSSVIENDQGEIATAIFSEPIPSETISPVESMALNNHHIPREIIVRVEGVVCSSGPQMVTNDDANRNSSFFVEISTRDMVVTSATAIIPEQIFDTTTVVGLPESEHEINSAVIDQGTLAINMVNRMAVESVVSLSIPSLTAAGSDFLESITILPNEEKNVSFDLSNYTISPTNNEIDITAEIQTESTDPEKVDISKSDGMDFNADFYGENSGDNIGFKEFTGTVNQEPMAEDGEISIDSDTRITSAEISRGTFNITINNEVIHSIDENLMLNLSIDNLKNPDGQPLSIGPVAIEPGINQLNINQNDNSLANYRLEPVENFTGNQLITYNAEIVVPDGATGTYLLYEDFETNISLTNLEFSEITGFFDQEPIVTQDSVALPDGHIIQEAFFKEGILLLTANNEMGLNANIDIEIDELIHIESGDKLTIEMVLEENEVVTNIEIPLSDYKLYNEDGGQYLHYQSNVTIPSDDEMTLNTDQSIETSIRIENMSFQSIAGILDTVSVEIDSEEQEFEDFPEELKNINLEKVDLEILFDTNIGARIKMFIDLASYNDDGEKATLHINHLIDPNDENSKRLMVTDAADLMNISPNRLTFSGKVELFGEGEITSDQYISGSVNIKVPFILTIDEDTEIDIDKEKFVQDLPDELAGMKINALINNSFDIGGRMITLISKDSTDLNEDSQFAPDTLVNFRFEKNQQFDAVFNIQDYLIEVLRDSCYMRHIIQLDPTGPNEQIKFFMTDSLKLLMNGNIKALVDLKDEEEVE